MQYKVGDKAVTKKSHPCGNNVWTITRTGADVKIVCDKCGRIVMLDALKFEKSVKKIIGGDNNGLSS